jgi:hypothetical protein
VLCGAAHYPLDEFLRLKLTAPAQSRIRKQGSSGF